MQSKKKYFLYFCISIATLIILFMINNSNPIFFFITFFKKYHRRFASVNSSSRFFVQCICFSSPVHTITCQQCYGRSMTNMSSFQLIKFLSLSATQFWINFANGHEWQRRGGAKSLNYYFMCACVWFLVAMLTANGRNDVLSNIHS